MMLLLMIADAAIVIGGLGLAVIGGNHLRLVALSLGRARTLIAQPPPLLGTANDSHAPHVAVQIPVFDEPESVEGALRAAAALDWPRARLTIQLLDDSNEENAAIGARIARALSADGHDVRHLRRNERRGYKAGALAAGMADSPAEFFFILDADHRAPSDLLRRAMALLLGDERAAFAQFRFEFRNRDENLLTRVQQLLTDSHFVSEQPGRDAAGEPFQFNGTAAVWRRRALEDAGGWSPDTLAEDLDLVLRVYERGWHGRLALAPAVTSEAPASLGAWRRQQQRWSKGFSQAAVKLLPRLWRTDWPPARKLGASLLLGLQAAFPCALLAIGGFVTDMAIRGPGTGHLVVAATAAAMLVLTLAAITVPGWVLLRRGGALRYLATLAATPPLLGLLALSTTPAMIEGLAGRHGAFERTPKTGRTRP